MKSVKLFIALIFVFISASASSQVPAYPNILGKWKSTTKPEVVYHFLDSVRVKVNSTKYGTSDATYQIVNLGQHTKLIIEIDNKGIIHQTEYFVKQLNGKNLRLENSNTYDPIVQTTPNRTGLWLIRQEL